MRSVHGQRHTRGYSTWAAMMGRCYNPKLPGYANYGGRGIAVCERWHDSGEFLRDMGQPPPGTSLDRLDNDGNYELGNCRWATRSTQARNTRTTVLLTVDGVTRPLADWADAHGILAARIHDRLRMGWSHKEAVLRPVRFGQRRAYDQATIPAFSQPRAK